MTAVFLQNARSALTGTLMQRMMQLAPISDYGKGLLRLEVPPPESLSSASPRMLIDLFEEVRQPMEGFEPLSHVLDGLDKTKRASQRFMMAEQILDEADSFLYKTAMLTWIELQMTGRLTLTIPYVRKYIEQINLGLDLIAQFEKKIINLNLINDYRNSLAYQLNSVTAAISILHYFDSEDPLVESASRISSLGPKKIDIDGNVAVTASPVRYRYACRLGRALMRSAKEAVWLTDQRLYLRFKLSKSGRPKNTQDVLERFSWPLIVHNSALASAMRFLGWSLNPKQVENILIVRVDFSQAK